MNWQSINWVDYVVIAIILVSLVISLIRGFVREALSLASWIIAFWVALTFNNNLAIMLQPYLKSLSVRTAVAFFILFAITLIIGSIINYLISTLVDKTGLSGTDRLLGIIFGFGRGVLLVAVILLAAQMTAMPNSTYWHESQLIPQFKPIGDWLRGFLPRDLQRNNQDSQVKLLPEIKENINQENSSLYHQPTADAVMIQ